MMDMLQQKDWVGVYPVAAVVRSGAYISHLQQSSQVAHQHFVAH